MIEAAAGQNNAPEPSRPAARDKTAWSDSPECEPCHELAAHFRNGR